MLYFAMSSILTLILGLQELIDDIVYINEMRKLDDAFFDTTVESKRYGPSDIVPITGLIVNRIHRVENELKTVLDHWKGRMPS